MYRIVYPHNRILVSLIILFCCFLANAQQKEIACCSEDNAVLIKIDTIGIGAALDCLVHIFIENKNINSDDCYQQQLYDKKGTEMHWDTLGYSISTITSSTGKLKRESYLNPIVNLAYIKSYKEDKKSECGFLCNSEKVGIWKYFSVEGEIDSLVDYEKKRNVSFCEIFEIAKSFGMIGASKKLPYRKEFIQVAEQYDLTIKTPKSSFVKIGWPSLFLINQEAYHKNCKFTTSLRYTKEGNTWNVSKCFHDNKKSYCFGIAINTKHKIIIQFESTGIQ